MNEEESLEEQIKNLVTETRQHPQGTIQRQRGLNRLIPMIQRSGKIWKDSSPDYEDALQATWEYFCKNLSAYDPQKASVITWFNNYLKWRLLDQRIERQKQINIFVKPDKNDVIDIIGIIPSPENHPDSEEDLWDFVCKWIEDDSDGKFKGTHVRDRPDANAQLICLRRLAYEKPNWQNQSTELGISVATLSGFYRTQCICLLKEIPVIKQAYKSREAK